MSDKIEFDVLIRNKATDETPDVNSIDLSRPEPEDIEKCRQWLVGMGIACFATEFGLACSASRELFESLFSTRLEPLEKRPGRSRWQLQRDPKPPVEIADYVKEITLSVPPELF